MQRKIAKKTQTKKLTKKLRSDRPVEQAGVPPPAAWGHARQSRVSSAAHVYPQTRRDPSGVASLLLASDFSDACNATAALADVVVSYMERPLSKGQYIYGGDRVFIVMSRTEPPALPRTSEQLAAAI